MTIKYLVYLLIYAMALTIIGVKTTFLLTGIWLGLLFMQWFFED